MHRVHRRSGGYCARMASVYRPPWRIDIDVREGVAAPLTHAALARVAAGALEAAGAPEPASLGLILSDDAELGALNERHMGHEGPTDVLSFPLLPPESFRPHEGQRNRAAEVDPNSLPRPPRSRLHLGDIVVSVERAIEQARTARGGHTGDVRWEPSDEMRLLVIHGVLHVCGWDHAEPDEERAMRQLERQLLSSG